jgi:hypothetical protein
LEDYQDNELISRAHAIMKNIHELVNKKLEIAERHATLQEVQRTIISDVSLPFLPN